jgi:hypothetical protein
MDSVLELEASESRYIRDIVSKHRDLFLQVSPQLFEDCFHLLLSTSSKVENFTLLKSLSGGDTQEDIDRADALN